MIFASCCGPLIDTSTPDTLRRWATVMLVCGLLLLGEAGALAWMRRRECKQIWRQWAVALPVTAAVAAFVLTVHAWNAYLTAPSLPVTSEMVHMGTTPVSDAISAITPLCALAALVTLVLLMIGLVELAIHVK